MIISFFPLKKLPKSVKLVTYLPSIFENRHSHPHQTIFIITLEVPIRRWSMLKQNHDAKLDAALLTVSQKVIFSLVTIAQRTM